MFTVETIRTVWISSIIYHLPYVAYSKVNQDEHHCCQDDCKWYYPVVYETEYIIHSVKLYIHEPCSMITAWYPLLKPNSIKHYYSTRLRSLQLHYQTFNIVKLLNLYLELHLYQWYTFGECLVSCNNNAVTLLLEVNVCYIFMESFTCHEALRWYVQVHLSWGA